MFIRKPFRRLTASLVVGTAVVLLAAGCGVSSDPHPRITDLETVPMAEIPFTPVEDLENVALEEVAISSSTEEDPQAVSSSSNASSSSSEESSSSSPDASSSEASSSSASDASSSEASASEVSASEAASVAVSTVSSSSTSASRASESSSALQTATQTVNTFPDGPAGSFAAWRKDQYESRGITPAWESERQAFVALLENRLNPDEFSSIDPITLPYTGSEAAYQGMGIPIGIRIYAVDTDAVRSSVNQLMSNFDSSTGPLSIEFERGRYSQTQISSLLRDLENSGIPDSDEGKANIRSISVYEGRIHIALADTFNALSAFLSNHKDEDCAIVYRTGA